MFYLSGVLLLIIAYRLKENSHLLQPPINNYCVYDEHMTVMVSLRVSQVNVRY